MAGALSCQPRVAVAEENIVDNPLSWLINSTAEQKRSAAVDAPTFSITKVYTLLALVLTPLGTLLATRLDEQADGFSPGQIVALTAAMLGFASVALAADILGRAWVTAATVRARAESEAAGLAQIRLTPALEGVVPLEQPVRVTISANGRDPEAKVLAARYTEGKMLYFVQQGTSPAAWLDHDVVTFR